MRHRQWSLSLVTSQERDSECGASLPGQRGGGSSDNGTPASAYSITVRATPGSIVGTTSLIVKGCNGGAARLAIGDYPLTVPATHSLLLIAETT